MTQEQRRRQKYPDTYYFHYHNANPKGRVTTDCVIRAISVVLEKPYEDVLMEMAHLQCKTGYDMSENTCIDKYMTLNGWTRVKQPRKDDNTKFTGKEFCYALTHPIYRADLRFPDLEVNRVLAHIGGHHIVAIVEGQIWDIWNSAGGCIGQCWVKTSK